jgi:GntR family transcriptional regulator
VALDIAVDVDSPVPPYEQIRRQIAAFVQGGLLAPGARLPAMRALAADLGVAVGTVARAYTELESAGLVTSRRRTGTVVAEQSGRRPATDASVQAAALELAARAHASGLDEDAVLALVRAALVRTGAESAP